VDAAPFPVDMDWQCRPYQLFSITTLSDDTNNGGADTALCSNLIIYLYHSYVLSCTGGGSMKREEDR
jgi:hypothetical protein